MPPQMRLDCIFLTAVLSLAGCTGSSGPQTYPVSGKVVFEGQPVQEGQILFRDPAGQLATAGVKIINGEYSLRSTPGPKLVMITGYRPNGKFDRPAEDEPPIPVVEQYIPAQYNRKSELRAEIAAEDNEISFELKNAPSARKTR